MNSQPVVSILLIVFITSCSQIKPEFTRDYFPVSYQHGGDHNWRVVLLNSDHQLNGQVIRFWLKGSYQSLYRQQHPIITLSRENLRELSIFLNQTAYIYYISWPRLIDVSLLDIESHLPCSPLSNIEIQFLFTGTKEQPFSTNGIALVFISAHELLQQLGWAPEYPRLLSTRLRSAKGLTPLKKIDSFNLFAIKKSLPNNSHISPGFIICRRDG